MNYRFSDTLKNLPGSVLSRLIALADSLEDVVSLGVGEPDFDTPWPIRAESIYHLENGDTFYSPTRGFLELRQQIANYLNRRFGLTYDPETEVMCTVGGSQGIDLVFRCLINPGDEVLIPQPGYMAYEPCAVLSGAKVVPVLLKEENGFKLKAEELKKAITDKSRILVLNFPGNPTGGVMTKEDYLPLVDLIIKHDLLVVSDEIYGELSYSVPHYSIALIPEIRDRVILLSGFSKTFSMTGWRLGYLCAAKELIDNFAMVSGNMIICTPTITQYGGIVAMRDCDKEIPRMKASFLKRRDLILSGLEQIGLPCCKPEGAFYVFPNIKQFGLSSADFCAQLIQRERLVLCPGSAFGAAGEGYVRCSYSYSKPEIQEALKRLGRFVSWLRENK